MRSQPIVLFLFFQLGLAGAYAQTDKSFDAEKYRKHSKKFFDGKIGEPFYPIDEWTSLNAGQFDMSSISEPVVLFLGFESCAPCRAALPVFADVSKDSIYAKYKFVYMTFDDTATLSRELSGLQPGNRIIALPVERDYIQKTELVLGFPTIYFIDSKKIVRTINAYGADTGNIASKNYWYSQLNRLK